MDEANTDKITLGDRPAEKFTLFGSSGILGEANYGLIHLEMIDNVNQQRQLCLDFCRLTGNAYKIGEVSCPYNVLGFRNFCEFNYSCFICLCYNW